MLREIRRKRSIVFSGHCRPMKNVRKQSVFTMQLY